MSSSQPESQQSSDKKEEIVLLESFYGDYFSPVVWETSPKSKNYFAVISPGTKYPFNRKFLRSITLDNQIVFRGSDFLEEAIVEQKAVYVKGTKEEVVFHGFFIIHHTEDQITGEEISQKEALQYFDIQKELPDFNTDEQAINRLRVKLGTTIRKFAQKYGQEVIVNILSDILEEYFPD